MDPLQQIINESNLSPEEVRFLVQQGFVGSSADLEQNTPEWLEAKLGKASASEAREVVTRNRYGKPYEGYYTYMIELAVERVGGKKPRFSSRYTSHGHEYEPAAAEMYEQITGYEVRETGFHEHKDLMAGCSPDRLVGDDGLLQIKAPNSATLIRYMISMLDEDDPNYGLVEMLGLKGNEWKYYFEQMQFELWITGRKWNDFGVYDPDLPPNCQMVIERVPRDNDYIEKTLEPRVREFLANVDRLEFFLRNVNGGLE
jgi:hypothetical protein